MPSRFKHRGRKKGSYKSHRKAPVENMAYDYVGELVKQGKISSAPWINLKEGSKVTIMSDVELYKAESVTVSQELLLQVGQWANGNVYLQQRVVGGNVSIEFRMFCHKCAGDLRFKYRDFLKPDITAIMKSVETFCKQHRHEVIPIDQSKKYTKKLSNPFDNEVDNDDEYIGEIQTMANGMAKKLGQAVDALLVQTVDTVTITSILDNPYKRKYRNVKND